MRRAVVKIGHSNLWPGSKELKLSILQQLHMATNRPQGDLHDLVGWRKNTKHFQLGKTTEVPSVA